MPLTAAPDNQHLVALTGPATQKYFELLVHLPLNDGACYPHSADPIVPSPHVLGEQKLSKTKPAIVMGSPIWPHLLRFCVRAGPATILKASQD
jgi:hypothetical protein